MKIFDYRYRARRLKDGKIVKGMTEAPNKNMVDKFLQEQGLKPIEIYQQKTTFGDLSRISFGKVLKERDLIFYLRQLGSLLTASVKLNEASEILATQHFNLAKEIFKKTNVTIDYLSGKTEYREKKRINEELMSGKIDLNKADPISEKSTKFFSSHSTFAPRSKTTLISFLLGHNPASAGLLTSFIVFKIILEITNNTPVLPAERVISAFSSTCDFTDNHMLEFFEFLTAVKSANDF